MKTYSRQLITALALCATAGTVASQTTSTMPGSASVPGRSMTSSGDDWQRNYRATKIIGTDVRNTRGDKIGDIKDLVLDRNGAISYAVISTGGFLGVGDRLHAVPWNVLQSSSGRDYRVLDIEKDRLKSAPGFDSNKWPNVTDEKWGEENRRFYQGQGQSGSSTTPTNRGSSTTSPTSPTNPTTPTTPNR